MAGSSKTTVHIFLDTNALFTEAADRLIAIDLSDFISKSLENDPRPQWYIPSCRDRGASLSDDRAGQASTASSR